MYMTFMVGEYVRRIAGWRVNRRTMTELVLDALEQALHARRIGAD
jgi:putative transposase